MIDKNKIRKAAEKASVAYSGNSYDYQEGFKAGINWFLKNLQHPMSDKPEMGAEILILRDMKVYRKNHLGISADESFVHEFDFHDNWDDYANDSEYKGWLYIGNLVNSSQLDLDTPEIEKQQLFDALAKENKRWNSETKTLEDLSKKYEPKPFDKVLVRDTENDEWRISLFSHYSNSIYPYFCINTTYKYCIPYNEHTKHLLGTTDDWKGGEE